MRALRVSLINELDAFAVEVKENLLDLLAGEIDLEDFFDEVDVDSAAEEDLEAPASALLGAEAWVNFG